MAGRTTPFLEGFSSTLVGDDVIEDAFEIDENYDESGPTQRAAPAPETRGAGPVMIVCGGRNYGVEREQSQFIHTALGSIRKPCLLVHGDATGVDRVADGWAEQNNVPICRVPANWARNGSKAGPLRNRVMATILKSFTLMGFQARVVAFPGGAGTASMIRIAESAGLEVLRFG